MKMPAISGYINQFMGIKVVTNPHMALNMPVIQLSTKVPVSHEFRIKCDAWYLEMFGVKPFFLMTKDTLITHPANLKELKSLTQKEN